MGDGPDLERLPPPRRRLLKTRRARKRALNLTVYAVTLVVVAGALLQTDWPLVRDTFFDSEIFADQFPDILTIAAKNTVIYTVLGFGLGLVFGLVIALMRLSSLRPYRWFATVYIETFRGLPALVTILLIGYAVPIGLGVDIPGGDYGPGTLALAIVAGAYMAETIRAGIQAVPKGQTEAARSLGMSYGLAMATVIIPQAFRIILPPLTNELVLLVKDTSLLSVLGTTPDSEELVKFGQDGMTQTFNGTPLIAAALCYIAISVPLSQIARYLERRGGKGR